MSTSNPGKRIVLCLLVLCFSGFSGCASPISKPVMETVDPGRPFSLVVENPQAYIGSIVLWGGTIEKIVPGPEKTRVFVTQCPVDSKGVPQTDATYGEFIAHTPDSLDPLLFHRGMVITIAGMLDGVEEEPGPVKISRPLVRVIEIHPWTGRGEGLRKR